MALIALAIPTSVSRSAVLSVGVALAVLLVLMPARQRLLALGVVPFALVAVFMLAPGVIGILASFFDAGANDASVATRVNDYPLVARVRSAIRRGLGAARVPTCPRTSWPYSTTST